MTETIAAGEIAVSRVFDAPRELVWRAWTEPEQLTRWWGKRGWTAPLETITVDLRPGGVFRLVGVNDEDGREMPTDAVFREIVEPERLVFAEPGRDDCHEGAVSTVTFADLGDGRTEVRLHTTMHAPEEIRRAAEAGLASALDRLAETLESR
jgi:uncharacterized protein YndB with AHSA1/START domain